jgi:hypothetical protein
MTTIASFMVAGAMHAVSAAVPPAQSDDTCVIVRISSAGRRTVIDEDHPDYDRYRWGSARAGTGRDGAYASASSSGAASSHSSVSVSSSSRNGGSTSRASASDGERTVTTTRDRNGCTTVFDERAAQRSDR